jgi:hypothetical protein
MLISSISRYFNPLKFRYSPHHSLLKDKQAVTSSSFTGKYKSHILYVPRTTLQSNMKIFWLAVQQYLKNTALELCGNVCTWFRYCYNI